MPAIDRTPPYLQVVQAIRERIVSGELRDGEAVPSVRQIAADWNISQATALKALSALKAEGLVESVQGVGTLVRTASMHRSPADRFARMTRLGTIYSPGEHARIIAAEIVPAPERVADAFGVDEGTPVVRRHRVTYSANEEAVSASTSWFTADLAEAVPSLLVAERIKAGTPRAIEEATGRGWQTGEDRPSARAASAEEAAELGIAEGSPVLVVRTFLRDQNGDVLEYGESASHPDRETAYGYERS
jgi:DNA-binding GntR family transcriptional regulator